MDKLNRVPVCVRLSASIWKRTKIQATREDRRPGQLVDEALRQYLAEASKNRQLERREEDQE